MNYIPQIAKMLGVEMGERFTVKYTKRKIGTSFYFAEDGLHNEESSDVYSMTLAGILYGKYEIKKLPWKPEEDEIYYIPIVAGGTADYDYHYWNNEQIDLPRYNANLVCRTKEEALEKAEKMLAVVKDDE